MTRLTIKHAVLTALTAAAAAVLLAACSSSSNSGAAPSTSSSGGDSILATHDASGVGTVLANAGGMTLYTAEQESNGTIKCTGACVQVWRPVTAASASAPNGVTGKIGTTTRSDDKQTQLTYNGVPLYTFAEDAAPGDAKGNDAKDAFGGNHFSWHAVIVTPSTGGASTSSSSSGAGGGGGY